MFNIKMGKSEYFLSILFAISLHLIMNSNEIFPHIENKERFTENYLIHWYVCIIKD